MSKKIVVCANTSWNLYNFRLGLMRALKAKGYTVVAAAPYDEYAEKLMDEFEYHDLIMSRASTNPFGEIKTLLSIYKTYRKTRPDVSLGFTIKPNIYGNIACSFLGIKSINNISGLGTVFVNTTFLTKIAKVLYKYALGRASKVFFQNSEDRELFVNNNLVRSDKSSLLPGSGVDTAKFTRLPKMTEDGKLRFLMISRMIPAKGVKEFVDAAQIVRQKHPDAEFQLIGAIEQPGFSKEDLERWSSEGSVSYLGVTSDIISFIREADCVVLPSYYKEGTPKSLLEGASMGKPIITTDTPGCRDVVEDGVNGFLCEPRSAADLAEKMEKIISLTEQERESMAQASRDKVIREFDENIVIAKYLEAVEQSGHSL